MTMVAKQRLANLVRDTRGGVAVVYAMFAIILCGFAALAIDAGNLYATQTRLQGAASAAALAAAQELPNPGQAKQQAQLYAGRNMPVADHGQVLKMVDIVVGEWDEDARSFDAAGTSPNAVHVITRRAQTNGNPVPTSFAALMGFAEVDVSAEAIAVAAKPPICFLALNATASAAFDVGNGSLDANGCSVQVNSSHGTEALTGAPNGSMSAESICVAGGYSNKPAYAPQPESCEPRADPLAGIVPPAVGACDYPTGASLSSGDGSLSPGVYCGDLSITTNGTATLDPGLYVIKDGTFSVASQATVIGEGVTFYLVGDSSVSITGGATLTLKAMTTGALAGLLFYGDPSMPSSNEVKFAGGASAYYEGAIYFPASQIDLLGGASATAPSPYSVFIADTFRLNGNGAFVVNSDYALSTVPPPPGLMGSAARLVM